MRRSLVRAGRSRASQIWRALEGKLSSGERAEKLCGGFGRLGGWLAILPTGDGEGVHRWEANGVEQRTEVYPCECGDRLECKRRVGYREVLPGGRDRQMLESR